MRVWFGRLEKAVHFLAFDFAPLLHSCSSAVAFFAFSAAAFWLAASAFWSVGGQHQGSVGC